MFWPKNVKAKAPTIKINGRRVVNVEVYGDYNELGATMTDDYDEDISNLELYKWSSQDLINQSLSTIEGDKYIVRYDLENPNNCEVYYIDGFNEKYSLTDLQDE